MRSSEAVLRCPPPREELGRGAGGGSPLLSASYRKDHLLSIRGSPQEGIRLSGRRAGAGCVQAWSPPSPRAGLLDVVLQPGGSGPGQGPSCLASRGGGERSPSHSALQTHPVPTPLLCSVAAPPPLLLSTPSTLLLCITEAVTKTSKAPGIPRLGRIDGNHWEPRPGQRSGCVAGRGRGLTPASALTCPTVLPPTGG